MTETLAEVYDAIRLDPVFEPIRAAAPGIVLVPGEGASRPNIMIVGEAPGATENTAQRPFVGPAGQALRSLIKDCALLRPEDYFITNVLKYRPTEAHGRRNRTPVPYETSRAVPYLRREWSALGYPRVLVAVGGIAKNALAAHLPGVTQSAGHPHPLSNGRFIWPMIHPSYVLRKSGEELKRLQRSVEGHWEQLGNWYREEGWK